MVKPINESNIPELDTTNMTQKGIDTFSKTYKLNNDLWIGNVGSYEFEDLLEYSPFADLILKQGFWNDENGDVHIPTGTEVVMRTHNDHTRQVDLYFVNVPEFGNNPVIYGWDDLYAAGDWVEEIINNSTPVK